MEENRMIESTETKPAAEIAAEEPSNLDICPNCLEPNTDNLAVCKYCGMPLRPGADPDALEKQETEEELAANRAAATPPEPEKPKKKQESGFRRVMPWLGLYIIYYAITGFIDTSRKLKTSPEEISSPTLAYASWGIYIVAGLLMAWPLIKKGYRKLRHLPDPDEEAEKETAENTDGPAAEADHNSGETVPEETIQTSAETVPEETGSENQVPETETSAENEAPASAEEAGTAETAADLNSVSDEVSAAEEAGIDESESEFEEEDRDAARWL